MTLFAVSLALTGCGAARRSSTHTAGTEVRAIDVGGVDREFRVHIPHKRARESALVVVIHGGFGSAEQAENAYGWNEVAESEGLIVAYPSGKGVAWNAGTCCGRAAHNDVDDVGFVAAMVAALQEEYGVSPDRTFATGMSNGAMMTYRLACETDLFAAIAPVAGTIVTDCVDPSPTSVLHIHGRDDERVRYDGEVGSGATRVDGLAVEEDVALWRAAGECPEPQVTAKPPLTTTTANCPEGRTVSLIAIDGAGHQWPGASTNGLSGPDPASTALDATAVIWKFFDSRKG